MSHIKTVRKRDGRIVEFDKQKIANAIFKAASAVGGKDQEEANKLAEKVAAVIEYQFDEKSVPTVEEVQDVVEKVLMKSGHAKTAKAYILYRQQHQKIRETRNALMDVNHTISEYLNQSSWRKNENSNEQYSFSGLLLFTAGRMIANYTMNEIYTKEIAEAHAKGYIHIHDITHGFIGYCAGWSLKNLLLWGFGGVRNKVDAKPAKHMRVVIHQMVNYIGCLQMEFAGAQAFSSVDTYLAPFVKVDNLSYDEIKQNMQELVYSLNIPSRWGSQYPFSNLTFDWIVPVDLKKEKAVVGGKYMDFTYGDCQKEMDMVNRAFLEVMMGGDANGRIFSFPIPTYNITKDFNWDSENANLLFEATAKYGMPYFQNYVGSGLDPRSIRAMCCRLNLDQTELINRPGHLFAPGDSTGSLGVVTMNLNRMGYEAKNEQEFLDKLGFYMNLAKTSLETKREIVNKNMENGLMPYAKRYLGNFNNHFSTIGLCGMNECCLNLIGKDITTPEGKELTIRTLNFMRQKVKQFQQETGRLYNLEATPAESTAYRFALLDKEMYPDIITSGDKEPFLTNSTQIPVDHTDDLIMALEHQNDIQPLYTGGTIFHTFIGEKISSGEACKKLVRKIAENTRIPYFSITPTFSICRDHGYMSGQVPVCPKCEKECEVYSRIVGYYRPTQNWNKGKQEEFRFRKTFSEQKALAKDFKKAEACETIAV